MPVFVGNRFESLSDYQSESANHEFGPFADEIIRNPDKLYLDLGCGLRRRVHSNCLYLEVYPSVSADIVVPPTCLYPIEDNTFDGIGCFAVMEHTRKPWKVAEEIHRMLKPGGKIWIDWPFLQPVHGYPSHYFNTTREGLRSIFEDIGFKTETVGTWSHQTPDFALCWQFDILRSNLPADLRADVDDMKVSDLFGAYPSGELWKKIVGSLDDRTLSTLACGNCLVATK